VPKTGEGCYKETPLEKDEILNWKTKIKKPKEKLLV
jgi:hypothetical protein